jgi:hypothetical protein
LVIGLGALCALLPVPDDLARRLLMARKLRPEGRQFLGWVLVGHTGIVTLWVYALGI